MEDKPLIPPVGEDDPLKWDVDYIRILQTLVDDPHVADDVAGAYRSLLEDFTLTRQQHAEQLACAMFDADERDALTARAEALAEQIAEKEACTQFILNRQRAALWDKDTKHIEQMKAAESREAALRAKLEAVESTLEAYIESLHTQLATARQEIETLKETLELARATIASEGRIMAERALEIETLKQEQGANKNKEPRLTVITENCSIGRHMDCISPDWCACDCHTDAQRAV